MSETKDSIINITDKDWLDLSWKYFQQHAQQRISYFNFFVVFSTILTTGFVTNYQNKNSQNYLCVGIGIIEMFLSIMFLKIEERNRFLIRHSEDIIKAIEMKYENLGLKPFKLFTLEDKSTLQLKESQNKQFVVFKQISHGMSSKILYLFFMFLGLIEIIITLIK